MTTHTPILIHITIHTPHTCSLATGELEPSSHLSGRLTSLVRQTSTIHPIDATEVGIDSKLIGGGEGDKKLIVKRVGEYMVAILAQT
ncbi:hypothetical protein EON65_50330 [archaeon]|nr:MAG: hypothetical protein EON65_50330 [archaeon]